MSIQFRRHAPPCLDAAIHRIFDSLTARPALRGAFTRLLTIARGRSDLLRDLPPPRTGRYPQLDALRTLAGYHRGFLADPLAWPGATYARRCIAGVSRIWSLRRVNRSGPATPVLTIEVDPQSQQIVQLRGDRNQRASGLPLALVRQWADRCGLRFVAGLAVDPPPPAAPAQIA